MVQESQYQAHGAQHLHKAAEDLARIRQYGRVIKIVEIHAQEAHCGGESYFEEPVSVLEYHSSSRTEPNESGGNQRHKDKRRFRNGQQNRSSRQIKFELSIHRLALSESGHELAQPLPLVEACG